MEKIYYLLDQMQNILVIFIVIIALSCLAVAIACRKAPASSSSENFFLANRSISWPLLFMTFLGTQVGGGFILGTADATYSLGIGGAMYSIGLSIGMIILSCGIASRLRKLEVNTVSEILEKAYRSQLMKQLCGVLSILSLGGILIALAIGLRKFLLSLSINEDWMFLLSWLSVIAYTTHGGLLAIVWTDFVQATGMIITLIISFIWIIIPHSTLVQSAAISSIETFELTSLPIATLFVPMLFMLIEQDMAQRAFSAKSAKDATVASFATAIALLILTIIPVSFGFLARGYNIDPQGGSVFIMVAKQCAPEWVFLAASSAVLLAILSTASSVLLAVSSNTIQDIACLAHISPKKMTFFIGFIAAVLSYYGSDIISWMVASYEVSVYTLFVPIMAALFMKWDSLSYKAALWSVLGGGGSFVIVSFMHMKEYQSVAIPFATSFFAFLFQHLYSSKKMSH